MQSKVNMTDIKVFGNLAEVMYNPPQGVRVFGVLAEVMYKSLERNAFSLNDAIIERVLIQIPVTGERRYVAANDVILERVLREYPELRGWGLYDDNTRTFIPLSALGFYITSYSGADLAEYELVDNGQTRTGEVPNGEFYAPRQITLVGRVIGESYSDVLKKTERMLRYMRPSRRAEQIGDSRPFKLAFFGERSFIVFNVKLSGDFALPIDAKSPCVRDVTLIFTSQDWPFGYKYDGVRVTTTGGFTELSVSPFSYVTVSRGGVTQPYGPQVYPQNAQIKTVKLSEDWLFIAGNFTSLYGANELGYAAVYNVNDETWRGLDSPSLAPELRQAVRSITSSVMRARDYIFCVSSGGVHYFAYDPLSGTFYHYDDPGAPAVHVALREYYGTPVIVLNDGRIRERNITGATWIDRGTVSGAIAVAVVNDVYYVATPYTVRRSTNGGASYTTVAAVSGGTINSITTFKDRVIVYGTFTSANGDTAYSGMFAINGATLESVGWPGGVAYDACEYGADLYVAGGLPYVGETGEVNNARWGLARYDGVSWIYEPLVVRGDGGQLLKVAVNHDSIVVANTHLQPITTGSKITVYNDGEYSPCKLEISATYDTWPFMISNSSTGERIVFEKRMLVGGETVMIDTSRLAVSTTANRRAPYLARGTTSTFGLKTGSNEITVIAAGYASFTVSFNDAVDGVGAGEL